jgi:hypothetical protein
MTKRNIARRGSQQRRRRFVGVVVAVAALLTSGLVAAAPASASVTWTVQTTPNKGLHQSDFQAVSCPTSTSCMAVGSHGKSYLEVARAERFNGTSWTDTTVPTTSTHFSWFYGVSCTSATACTAVGADATSKAYGWWGGGTLVPDEIRPLIQRWNGTSWTVQALTVPSTWKDTFLRAVSCDSATHCVAVGNHAGNTIVAAWNGSAWSLQTAPDPLSSIDVRFIAISCTSTTSCVAVGRFTTASSVRALAEKWDGATWSLAAPLSPTGNNEFNGVSCTSSTACVAVGAQQTGTNTFVPLAESWNGATWTVMTTPVIAGGAHLRSVSCTAAAACMAVGVNRQSGHAKTLAMRLTGAGWSTTSSIPNVTTDNYTWAVSCSSATVCTAAGWDLADTGLVETNFALAARWNGTAWTSATTAADTTPLSVNTSFRSVSCTSSTACTAVGPNTLGQRPISARWDGTAWHVTAQPVPTDEGLWDSLNGVSCTSASACIGVGMRVPALCTCSVYAVRPLAERWNGTTWKRLTLASPYQDAGLNAVSCSAASACTAVGGGQTRAPAIERWNGTTWKKQSVTLPSSVTFLEFHGVSCASSTSCMAVGRRQSSTDGPTAARWNGTSWSLLSVPKPTGTSDGQLNAVSCKSSTACTAVGYWVTSGGSSRRLVERWNGTSWSIFDHQAAGGAQEKLAGVSCTTATACTAVGSMQTSTYDKTLAWHSSGTSKTLTYPGNPAPYGNSLLGVSCTTSTACTAVGERAVSAGTKTLAERSSA